MYRIVSNTVEGRGPIDFRPPGPSFANRVSPLTALVVGDHALVTEAIRSLIDQIGVCGDVLFASSGPTAETLLSDHDVDIAFIDLPVTDGGAVEVLGRIRRYGASLPVVVLAASAGATDVNELVEAGATGVIAKAIPPGLMTGVIETALSGKRFAFLPLDAFVRAESKDEAPSAHRDRTTDAVHAYRERLTEREAQVLDLVAKSLSNKEIGRRLGILEGTVKVHVTSILRKLGAKNRTMAALRATAVAETE